MLSLCLIHRLRTIYVIFKAKLHLLCKFFVHFYTEHFKRDVISVESISHCVSILLYISCAI